MEDYIGNMPILFLGNLGNMTAETPAVGVGESLLSSVSSFPTSEFAHYLVDLLEALLTLYLFPVLAHIRPIYDFAAHYVSLLLSSLSAAYSWVQSTYSVLSTYVQRYNDWCEGTNDINSFLDIDPETLASATRELIVTLGRAAADCERVMVRCLYDAFIAWSLERMIAWTSNQTVRIPGGRSLPVLTRDDFTLIKDLVVRSGILVFYVFV